MLKRVKQDGGALEYASADLKGDKDIVMEAVKQDRQALQYASAALRSDRELVELQQLRLNPAQQMEHTRNPS